MDVAAAHGCGEAGRGRGRVDRRGEAHGKKRTARKPEAREGTCRSRLQFDDGAGRSSALEHAVGGHEGRCRVDTGRFAGTVKMGGEWNDRLRSNSWWQKTFPP